MYFCIFPSQCIYCLWYLSLKFLGIISLILCHRNFKDVLNPSLEYSYLCIVLSRNFKPDTVFVFLFFFVFFIHYQSRLVFMGVIPQTLNSSHPFCFDLWPILSKKSGRKKTHTPILTSGESMHTSKQMRVSPFVTFETYGFFFFFFFFVVFFIFNFLIIYFYNFFFIVLLFLF